MSAIRTKSKWLILLVALVLALGGCGQTPAPTEPTPAAEASVEYGILANGYLTEFSAIPQRVAGTETEAKAADWIEKQLTEIGYTVTRESFSFEEEGVQKTSQNLIAVKPGKSPAQVIVGGHYDSKDIGAGADDNGSGVAVLLETAKMLKDVETPQTLKFIFFGAEEVELNGSTFNAGQMTPEDVQNTVLMINFDSLIAGDISYVYGNPDEKGRFRDRVLEIAKADQLELITQPGENPEYPAGTTGDWSDHAPYKALGLPVIYFESTNWTLGEKDGYTQTDTALGENGEIWHTDFDTLAYIEKTFPGRIAQRLQTFSHAVQALLKEDLTQLK